MSYSKGIIFTKIPIKDDFFYVVAIEKYKPDTKDVHLLWKSIIDDGRLCEKLRVYLDDMIGANKWYEKHIGNEVHIIIHKRKDVIKFMKEVM